MKPLGIALIGMGQMGQEIEKLSPFCGSKIVAKIDPHLDDCPQRGEYSKLSEHALDQVDVCIDFSRPESVLHHASLALDHGKPIVIGTTGWSFCEEKVFKKVDETQGALLYGSNFSLGVFLFMQLVDKAGSLFGALDEYDMSAIEYHHHKKKDAPSGTAKWMQKTLEKASAGKREVPCCSVRCGHLPGTHELLIDSLGDTITLSHVARNRAGFAQGALQGALWIVGKKGCYHFPQVASEILSFS